MQSLKCVCVDSLYISGWMHYTSISQHFSTLKWKRRKANYWSYGHNNIPGYQLTLAQQPRHLGYLNANRVGLGGGVCVYSRGKAKGKRTKFFFLFKSFQKEGVVLTRVQLCWLKGPRQLRRGCLYLHIFESPAFSFITQGGVFKYLAVSKAFNLQGKSTKEVTSKCIHAFRGTIVRSYRAHWNE